MLLLRGWILSLISQDRQILRFHHIIQKKTDAHLASDSFIKKDFGSNKNKQNTLKTSVVVTLTCYH